MKTKRNHIVLCLRFAASSAFFAAAAAFALVAATTNSTSQSGGTRATDKSAPNSPVVGANAAAIEEYSKRAYPANGISFDQTMNAIIGVKRAMATSASAATPTPTPGKGKPTKKSRQAPPQPP